MTQKLIDISSLTFGRLKVLGQSERTYKNQHYWKCLCDCGETCETLSGSLRSGRVRSCGCLRREGNRHKHDKCHTPEYRCWTALKSRCNNPTLAYYGEKGIKYCERWESFENFFLDMGEKPEPKKNYSIDRIDSNGPYAPENCRWATRSEQNLNRDMTNLRKRR